MSDTGHEKIKERCDAVDARSSMRQNTLGVRIFDRKLVHRIPRPLALQAETFTYPVRGRLTDEPDRGTSPKYRCDATHDEASARSNAPLLDAMSRLHSRGGRTERRGDPSVRARRCELDARFGTLLPWQLEA
jgi:hypothetical protein